MQIEINPTTRIISDRRQFIVQTRHRREKPDKEGNIYTWNDRGYFRTIESALQFLIDQYIRESEATDITALRNELAEYKEELAAAVADLRELPATAT